MAFYLSQSQGQKLSLRRIYSLGQTEVLIFYFFIKLFFLLHPSKLDHAFVPLVRIFGLDSAQHAVSTERRFASVVATRVVVVGSAFPILSLILSQKNSSV